MHLVHRAACDCDTQSLAFKNVTTLLSIAREKVKVVSGNTEGAGEAGRPEANEGPFHFFEKKFFLPRSRRFKARAFRDRFHHSRLHEREPTLNPERVKNVVRVTKLIADRNQSAVAIEWVDLLRKLGIESGDHGIWDQSVPFNRCNRARRGSLVADTIQHNHFSVKVDERPEPKVSMAQQARVQHSTLIQTFVYRRRGGSLEQGVDGLS